VGTVVFYMGVGKMAENFRRLVEHGRAADTPAAAIQWGTYPRQRTVTGTLETLPEIAREAGIGAPSLIVVGEVVSLRDQLAWWDRRPLSGRRIVVTRARAQASVLAGRLRALGARVVEAPAIRIEPLEARLPQLRDFDLLCVTSPNGAQRLLELVRDARALAGPAIAAIGPGTAEALRAGGIDADVVPPRAVAESLVESLAGRVVTRALIARAEQARDVLPDALRERGAQVEILALYRTVPEPLDDAARAGARGADYVTFTSASSVRSYVAAAGPPGDGQRIVSIGPVTSAALREHGLEPHVEARQHTPGGLLAALLADVAPGQLF
jgi:uroporphyrinogen III methyltransferase/synthase